MLRALIPPLTIILTLVTAVALIVTAAAMTPPSLTYAVMPAPLAVATAPLADGFTTLARSEPTELSSAPLVIGLARLTYAPGAIGPRLALPGPLLIAVEAGALGATLETPGRLARASGLTETAIGELLLNPGDSLMLPKSSAATFRGSGRAPAVALAAGVFSTVALGNRGGRPATDVPGAGTTLGFEVWEPSATVNPLAGGWAVGLTEGLATIAIERVSVAPGQTAPLAAAGAQALAVETGALTMVAEHGLIWLQHPDGTGAWLSPDTISVLLPGDVALLQQTASATLRNDGRGPLQVLVLSVGPGTAG